MRVASTARATSSSTSPRPARRAFTSSTSIPGSIRGPKAASNCIGCPSSPTRTIIPATTSRRCALLLKSLRVELVTAVIRTAFAALVVLMGATVHAECVNVRTAGAAGNGRTGDTAAIQKAVKTASVQRGGSVCLPAGDYLVTSTIVLDDVSGIRLVGEGGATRLVWGGNDQSPLLLLSSVQDGEVRDLQIVAVVAKPLAVGIQTITRAGAKLTSKHNSFVNVRIDGITRAVAKGFQIGGAPG